MSQVEFALSLRMLHLRQELPNLSFDQCLDVLVKVVWKKSEPQSLSQAINDVYCLNCEQIVQSLTRLATSEAMTMPLSAYQELLGGNYEEE